MCVYTSLYLQLVLLISFTEELLIDFRELVGEHSGENMAEAVWETLTQYGLIGRVNLIFSPFVAVNPDMFQEDYCICYGQCH